MNSFVHLHVHSHYSILDGMSKIPDLVDKCVANGMTAMALTDHGDMFGIKELLDYAAKKNGKVRDELKEIDKQLQADSLPDDERTALQQRRAEAENRLFKPIVGVEAYCARRSYTLKETKEDGSGWHLVLLAKNKTGYHNLCKLVSQSWIDGYYYRPRLDKEMLERYHEGLIVSSACLGGEIPQKIMAGRVQEAEEAIRWFKGIWGDDYYLEVQRHRTDKPGADRTVYEHQQEVNKVIFELAGKLGVKVIATNDVHFVEEEHGEAHDRLICLSTGKDLDDPNRMRYTKQEWLKTPDEMAAIFADHPEVLDNTLEVAAKVEAYSIDSPPLMPKFDIPADFGTEEEYRKKYTEEDLFNEFTRNERGEVVLSPEAAAKKVKQLGGYDKLYRIKLEADYLAKLAWEGAARRYPEITDEIRDRITFELYIMKTMGFPGYFLIVQDFIRAARRMGVSVGPGRGSAAGSVVAYCLTITDIDPLKYDLLFERFLNPDRISLPDIDIDFDDDGRGDVLRWVTEKYGKERVAHIITYGTMATKSAIKDVGRVQKVPLPEVTALTKLVPDKFGEDKADPKTKKIPKVNLANCFKYVPELKMASESADRNIADTLKYAAMLEGTVRQTGVHACGVIIGADDLTNFAPLSTAKEKGSNEDVLVTQYEGSVVESVGLIKMDFLGLKTLSIIKEAISNIKKARGEDLDISHIPIDDKKTYELFSAGATVGTFQFESAGMQKYLRELQPSTFEDLIAMNALYRPGPMDYIPQFIARKHGREPIVYDIPEMEIYLKDTYGITVYQEQVMLLSRLLADFTRGESDTLRKAMGKKLRDKLDHMKPDFITRGTKKGHDPQVLEKIWGDWEKFASYAFNKSHATCYSWVAYQTAYLKAHYPAEFMAANLTRNRDDIGEVSKFMDECKNMGIRVLGPDVNESELNFTVNRSGDIRFGLGGVKGVGEGAVQAIVKEREQNGRFLSIFDFIERVNLNACNKKAIESLALSGAFDGLGDLHREQLFVENSKGEVVLDAIMRYGSKYQNDKAMASTSLFGDTEAVEITKPEIPRAAEWPAIERLNKERELVGMYLSSHPLDEYEFEMRHLCNTTTAELKDLEALKGRSTIRVGGLITSVRNGTSKAGNPYGVFTLEDYEGPHEFALFGKNYVEFGKYMIPSYHVCVSGIVQPKGADYRFRREEQPGIPKEWEFKIQHIDELGDIKAKFLHSIVLSVSLQMLSPDFVDRLTHMVKAHKGNTNLYVEVTDDESNDRITLFSRQHRFEMNKDFYRLLKDARHDGTLLGIEVK